MLRLAMLLRRYWGPKIRPCVKVAAQNFFFFVLFCEVGIYCVGSRPLIDISWDMENILHWPAFLQNMVALWLTVPTYALILFPSPPFTHPSISSGSRVAALLVGNAPFLFAWIWTKVLSPWSMIVAHNITFTFRPILAELLTNSHPLYLTSPVSLLGGRYKHLQGGVTQIWFERECAAQASQPLPILQVILAYTHC